MDSKDDVLRIFSKGEEFLELFRAGRAFTEDLLRENERLRLRVLQAERDLMDARHAAEADAEMQRLRTENRQLREKLEYLDRRFTEVENENREFANQYVEVEAQNSALANLYVASHRLHSTLSLPDVAEVITEIIVGLIGAEEFAVFVLDEESHDLVLQSGEGVEQRFPTGRVPLGTGEEGAAAAAGQMVIGEPGESHPERALIPLLLDGECVGLIGIYRLLEQKRGRFSAVDKELLRLLAGQAATALMSARLFAAKDRRLRTMEGFMRLLRDS